jgi:hypothetical protein
MRPSIGIDNECDDDKINKIKRGGHGKSAHRCSGTEENTCVEMIAGRRF